MDHLFAFDAFDSEARARVVHSVDEEYLLVAAHAEEHLGIIDAFPSKQRLVERENGRTFDILFLELPDGSVREYWFDITSFYGR